MCSNKQDEINFLHFFSILYFDFIFNVYKNMCVRARTIFALYFYKLELNNSKQL